MIRMLQRHMIRYVISVLGLFVFALGGWAQNTPVQHQHQATVIDGAKNPEQIPDATAYRLWLVAVSLPPNSTEQERMFQQAHLRQLQFTSIDSPQLLAILTEFKSQYLDLIARYNESARAALLQGSRADQKLFLRQRDDLVSSTRAAIAQRLTPEGAARIEAHVQKEKSHIHLQTTGVQGQ
jgi:hypothetical protein